nr:hypothetical protein [Tanacetum cinerariifolium]
MTSLTLFCEIACQIIQKKHEEKRIKEEQAAKAQNRKLFICYDDDDDEEESNSLKDNIISELLPCSAVTPSEPIDSLSMGDEHLDTILATESDEFIKSCVENLSQTQSLHNEEFSEKIFSNPLFEEEIISIKKNQHHFNAESNLVESMLNHDSSIISSSSKINSLLDELLYDNSSPRPPEEFKSKNSNAEIESFSPSPIPNEDSDSFMEEIDLFLTPDDPMPPSIEDDNDSEGDILFLERFLHDDPIPLPDTLDFSYEVRVFLPFFTYPVTSPVLLSSGSEYKIFDPGIIYSWKFEDSCQRILSSKSSFPQLQLGIKTRASFYDSNPPNIEDWDHFFQPMFDEYFNPPTIVVFPILVTTKPRAVDIAESSVSMSVDLDAPSTNSSSHGSLSNMRPSHTSSEHLSRWTKDNPIANVIGDPSRSVSIRKQLKTDAMWCYFDVILTSIEPKNFKQAMTEPFSIDEPLAWYEMLSSFLISQHFFKGAVHPTLFTWKVGNDLLLMSFSLGLQISQSPRDIFLNQSKYAYEIIKKYGLLTIDFIDTPMIEKNNLDKDLQGTPVDATFHRGMIGSLMYLTSSRPDLIYSVCLCARYQAKPTEKHLNAVKQIFRFLKGTINMGLWYSKDTIMSPTSYSDAYHAGCQETRRRTSRSA